MKFNLDFSHKENMPKDGKLVALLFKMKNSNTPEITTAYRYRNLWWVAFTNPYEFPKEYHVLGWSEYLNNNEL